jgi:site-specific recombinase XerD
MKHIESILNFKRYLRRRNLSAHTGKNYLHRLQKFMAWVAVPIESVTSQEVKCYIDFLLEKRLSAQTINSHLVAIRRFYNYLKEEKGIQISNPVIRKLALRLPNPLPQHLRDSDTVIFLKSIRKPRDMAMFMLMLRCGLRVEEVANLTLGAIDYRRNQIMVKCGKGAKDRVVYISNDAAETLAKYLQIRQVTKEQNIFLVEKGTYKGKPISVRGIQKRIEYYSKKSDVSVSCHQLRHTMATQMLNADADLVTIQDLLGHNKIKTTQRYSKLSNVKAQRDYYNAMTIVMEKTASVLSQRRRH